MCRFTVMLFVALCCMSRDSEVLAQSEAKSATDAKPMDESKARKGPLPPNYGKIGMSDEQKAEAYEIIDEYKSQIDTLQQQVKKLLAERDAKLNNLLTAGQKTLLKELQEEAKKKAAVKTAPPVETVKKEPGT